MTATTTQATATEPTVGADAAAPQTADDSAPGMEVEAEDRPRNIVLFSDGTGNSSAKLQKTNVWRLYEAMDLGFPAQNGATVQIAYYDNGVGTSSVRLLAALGGIFGFGLARNIRDLYTFLCRNYREGDRIYAFGFSRGAYTIRLLVSLITSMGVVTGLSEADQELAVRDMWRDYRRVFRTNNAATDLLVCLARAARSLVIALKRRALRQHVWFDGSLASSGAFLVDWYEYWWRVPEAQRRQRKIEKLPAGTLHRPNIEFVGVWDTVAAYGGPFVELTRAIDEWIWPLTMPNYRLDPKVKVARHALAIDDKRDAFHPLLWDEVHDAELEQAGALDETPIAARPRLQQVWFAGMHSDVGGGYADETLSYVSLGWMIDHAQKAGLSLIKEQHDRILAMRNIYGPLHNSRGGGGAFYRYQPRYINAWLDLKPSTERPYRVYPATQIYRDPTVDAGRYRTRGLLRAPIRLHVSVEERLRLATDGYAPINLPGPYVVDNGTAGLSDPRGTADADRNELLKLGDRIKLRRFWYFVSVWLVLALVFKPLWPQLPLLRGLGGAVDARTDAYLIEAAANSVLPELIHHWTHAVANDLFTSLILFGLIGGSMGLGLAHERAMADIARQEWRRRFGQPVSTLPQLSWYQWPWHWVARWVHKSNWLQGLLASIKWRFVPVSLGAFLAAALVYVGAAAGTQAWLAGIEPRIKECPLAATLPREAAPDAPQWFEVRADQPCTLVPGSGFAAGETYRLRIELPEVAPPPPQTGWGRYFRRVVSAEHQAPVLVLRDRNYGGLSAWLFGRPIHVFVPEMKAFGAQAGPRQWATQFTVPADPQLFRRTDERADVGIFLNEAVLPLDPAAPPPGQRCMRLSAGIDLFSLCDRYANNAWTYRIAVQQVARPAQ